MKSFIQFLALFATAFAFAGMPDERFEKASAAMTGGDYGEAAYQLRELVSEGRFSHGSLHNLGNSEWKVVRPGHAILAWERARLLNPHDQNTQANLAFARKKSELPSPTLAWHESYSAWLSPNVWLASAALGFWGGVFLLTLPRLLGFRRADWHQGAAALLLTVFLLTVPALFGLNRRGNIGVALEDSTALRLTPTRDGEELTKLPAGEMARVEKTRGNYLYVRAEGDRAGWVRSEDFERVWETR
jgi:hypothetical protein